MKVHMSPERRARRGDPVAIGNVYCVRNSRAYSIVIAIVRRQNERPWNNVICLRVNAMGEVEGCEAIPEAYCSDHRDLVGKADKIPDFSVRWLDDDGGKRATKGTA